MYNLYIYCALSNILQDSSVCWFSIYPGISLTKQVFVCGDCAALNIHLGRIFIKAQNRGIVLEMNAPHMRAGLCWTSRTGPCSSGELCLCVLEQELEPCPGSRRGELGTPRSCPGLGFWKLWRF